MFRQVSQIGQISPVGLIGQVRLIVLLHQGDQRDQ